MGFPFLFKRNRSEVSTVPDVVTPKVSARADRVSTSRVARDGDMVTGEGQGQTNLLLLSNAPTTPVYLGTRRVAVTGTSWTARDRWWRVEGKSGHERGREDGPTSRRRRRRSRARPFRRPTSSPRAHANAILPPGQPTQSPRPTTPSPPNQPQKKPDGIVDRFVDAVRTPLVPLPAAAPPAAAAPAAAPAPASKPFFGAGTKVTTKHVYDCAKGELKSRTEIRLPNTGARVGLNYSDRASLVSVDVERGEKKRGRERGGGAGGQERERHKGGFLEEERERVRQRDGRERERGRNEGGGG